MCIRIELKYDGKIIDFIRKKLVFSSGFSLKRVTKNALKC